MLNLAFPTLLLLSICLSSCSLSESTDIEKTSPNQGYISYTISQEHMRNGDYDSAIIYLDRALTWYQNQNNPAGIASVLNNIGIIHNKLENLDSSIYYYQNALTSYQNQNDQIGTASTLSNIGIVHDKLGNFDSSIYHYQRALKIYKHLQDTSNIASLLSNIGIINKKKGIYITALEYLHEAAKIFETKENSSQLASCYNTMANIYSREGSYNRSIQYHKKAFNIRSKLNLVKNKASSLNNLGTVYLELNNLDSALWHFNASLDIKRTLNSKVHLVSTLNNIGLVFLKKKQLPDAEIYLEEALKLQSKITDRQSKARTLNYLGKLYINQSQFKKALVFLDSANRIILKIGLLDEHRENLETSIVVHKKLGNTDKALVTARHLLVIKDSLLNKERVQSLIEMQTRYETEKKEQSITLLEKEKNLQASEIALNRLWITLLIVSTVLILISTLFIVKSEKSKKRKSETLMQEVHHRVKNNLQLLTSIFSLQSRTLKDQNALDAIQSVENRVNAMAIIHQKLYTSSQDTSLNIQKYIYDLVEDLATSYGYDTDQEDVNIDVEDFDIDVDQIIPIGLIVNELVSNTFKYAFPTVEKPNLSIKIVNQEGDFNMEIMDNGPGFIKTNKSEESMGLNIIDTLSKQLKAKITWQTSGFVQFNIKMALNQS